MLYGRRKLRIHQHWPTWRLMVHHNSKKLIGKLTIFRSRHAWRSKKHFSASFIDKNLSGLLACSIKSYCQRYSVASFWCPSIHSKDVIVVCPFCCLVTPYKVRAILHCISFSYYYRATKRRVLFWVSWKSCKEQITHYDDKQLKQTGSWRDIHSMTVFIEVNYIETLRQIFSSWKEKKWCVKKKKTSEGR